ncbi:unnamed protein product [Periconia digitata]|uniref:Uncharacterized protein n=1 Tax=Periconia digitata TaxID=1303443 RepID=A0A9W4U3R7_9PLEO|nr:unnamed protein product [Periconia digitata]
MLIVATRGTVSIYTRIFSITLEAFKYPSNRLLSILRSHGCFVQEIFIFIGFTKITVLLKNVHLKECSSASVRVSEKDSSIYTYIYFRAQCLSSTCAPHAEDLCIIS